MKEIILKIIREYSINAKNYDVTILREDLDNMSDDMVREITRHLNKEGSPQDTPAIKKIDNTTYKEIISEEELKTYKGTLEWKDNKKYLILYGTGSYSIVTGSKVDTDEEIIEAYREALKKTLR
jgi:hypothetical protein